MTELKLWVDNQTEGIGHDATENYIDAANWTPPDGVDLDGNILSGDDSDAVWSAFRDLANAVEEAGHGDPDIDASEAAPNLTAAPVEVCETNYTSAAEAVARMESRQ